MTVTVGTLQATLMINIKYRSSKRRILRRLMQTKRKQRLRSRGVKLANSAKRK